MGPSLILFFIHTDFYSIKTGRRVPLRTIAIGIKNN